MPLKRGQTAYIFLADVIDVSTRLYDAENQSTESAFLRVVHLLPSSHTFTFRKLLQEKNNSFSSTVLSYKRKKTNLLVIKETHLQHAYSRYFMRVDTTVLRRTFCCHSESNDNASNSKTIGVKSFRLKAKEVTFQRRPSALRKVIKEARRKSPPSCSILNKPRSRRIPTPSAKPERKR